MGMLLILVTLLIFVMILIQFPFTLKSKANLVKTTYSIRLILWDIVSSGVIQMKLFKVKFQTSKTSNIFYAFVIAEMKQKRKRLQKKRFGH